MRSHHLLDLGDGKGRVQTLGAGPRAIENRVAPVHAHAVVQGGLALGGALVTRVGQPPVRLEQDGGTQVLLAVPPVRRTRGRAAGAQNALVQTVQLLALLGALAVFKALFPVNIVPNDSAEEKKYTYILSRGIALQVRLDGLVLLVELGQVRHQVLDDVHVRQRVDARLLGGIRGDPAQAGQGVGSVDVHGATATDTFTATAAESQGGVHLVLDADQSVQHHGAGLVQVEGVGLHLRLLGRLVGVPAVDLELLDARLIRGVGVLRYSFSLNPLLHLVFLPSNRSFLPLFFPGTLSYFPERCRRNWLTCAEVSTVA